MVVFWASLSMRVRVGRLTPEGQLSHKGFVEHVAVGVYEDRSGKGGRFLLVLRKDSANVWKKYSCTRKRVNLVLVYSLLKRGICTGARACCVKITAR